MRRPGSMTCLSSEFIRAVNITIDKQWSRSGIHQAICALKVIAQKQKICCPQSWSRKDPGMARPQTVALSRYFAGLRHLLLLSRTQFITAIHDPADATQDLTLSLTLYENRNIMSNLNWDIF
jgi:hypothetical protein